MSLINCEVSLILTWSESCVISSINKREVTATQGDNPAVLVFVQQMHHLK